MGNTTSYINEMSRLQNLGMACFTAGTQILTRDGYKNIEDIQAGDYVYSTDDKTGESDYKEVVEVYIKETDVVTHVYYVVNEEEQKEEKKEASQKTGSTTAEVREIETTLNHLFWCEGNGEPQELWKRENNSPLQTEEKQPSQTSPSKTDIPQSITWKSQTIIPTMWEKIVCGCITWDGGGRTAKY